MVFATTSGGLDAFFEHVFCFLDEESVQVDSVILHAAVCVVFTEDVVARLSIVLLHLCSVLLSLF